MSVLPDDVIELEGFGTGIVLSVFDMTDEYLALNI